MKVELSKRERGEAVIRGVFEGDRATISKLKVLNFKGTFGETVIFPEKERPVIFVGLGKKKEINEDKLRVAVAKGIAKAKKTFKEVCVDSYSFGTKKGTTKAVVEGVVLSGYSFEKYKEEKSKLERVFILSEDEREFELALAISESANFTRDIVNEPPNKITPEVMAQIAVELSQKHGFECKVFTEKELEENNMVGHLAVGRGSSNPPRFIHIKYSPPKAKRKIVFVGKGLTFDSGGLNIKPEQFMKTMKSDKSGACALLGIMEGVGKLKPSVEVHALLCCAENMPGGRAFKPDDILTYPNRKSVEVHSTDAEGRLVLADGLIYGCKLNPDCLIDIATLTGACIVALGHYTSGLFTYNDQLAETILSISRKTGEKMWRLPLDEDLEEEIKGTFTDLQNLGKSRYGGAITASLFLKNFVEKEFLQKWVHIDIAGPAFLDKAWKYYSPGATGQPVRTMLEFILKT